MALLTKEQILAADDLPRETVAVPEWGGEVIVRTMSGWERAEYEQGCLDAAGADEKKNRRSMLVHLCARTICSADGQPLFTTEEVEALGGKSAGALYRVFKVALKLNGIGKDDVKELAKKS